MPPFEGVYRELGYEALAAMRAAIGEAGPAGATIVPLALDSGGDPAQAQRSLRKLLADPALMGFVGPLLPWTAATLANDARPATGPGLLPFAANAEGLVALDEWGNKRQLGANACGDGRQSRASPGRNPACAGGYGPTVRRWLAEF